MRTSLASVLRHRWPHLLLVFTLALATIGAGDSGSRFNNIGHKMVCTCGCGQILLECNHVGCPNSPVMIDELKQQLGSGGTDTSIFNTFAAKYGPTVLAAPMRGGFDNVAYIVPISVFLISILGTAFLIKHWRGKHLIPAHAASFPTHTDAMRERIRRDTEF